MFNVKTTKTKDNNLNIGGIDISQSSWESTKIDVRESLEDVYRKGNGVVSCYIVAKHIVDSLHVRTKGRYPSFDEIKNKIPKNLKQALKKADAKKNWDWCPDDITDLRELYNVDMEYTKACNWFIDRGLDEWLLPSISIITPDLMFSLLNRTISEDGVEKCFLLLEKRGFNNQCRAILGKDGSLSDGQHRIIALFIAGLPYIYDRDPNLTFEVVAERNDATTPITQLDRVLNLKQKGNKHAERYMYFADKYSATIIYHGDDGDEGRSRTSTRSTQSHKVPDKLISSMIAKQHKDFSDFVDSICNNSIKTTDDEWINDIKPNGDIFLNYLTTKFIPNIGSSFVYTKSCGLERKDFFTYLWRIFETKKFNINDIEILGNLVLKHNVLKAGKSVADYTLRGSSELACVQDLICLYYKESKNLKIGDATELATQFVSEYTGIWKNFGIKNLNKIRK